MLRFFRFGERAGEVPHSRILARQVLPATAEVARQLELGRSPAQARQLQLPAGHPCALVHRQAFDWSGRCVQVRTTRGHALAFYHSVTIT